MAAWLQAKVVMEILRIMLELCMPYGPSFQCLLFDSKVGYGCPASSETEAQKVIYGAWLWFSFVKGSQWPLIPLFVCSLEHQASYNAYFWRHISVALD